MKSFATLLGVCTVTGFAINLIITRTFPRFLIISNFARIPLRFGIFGLPFGVLYPKLNGYYEEGNEMVEDQFIKIQRLRRTGNINEYFS